MNAKAVSVPAKTKKTSRSKMRISDQEYKTLAFNLRKSGLTVTHTNVAVTGAEVLARKFPIGEVTDARMRKIQDLILDMDAAQADRAKAQLTGTIAGVKNGDTADLLVKAIVRAEVEAATAKELEGMRKLLLAHEARLEQRIAPLMTMLKTLCLEWGCAIPEANEPAMLPVVEASGKVVSLPRVLVYGMQANQKQPLYDLVRSWETKDTATIDVGYSRDPVSTMKRGYDVIIYNRHWVGMDDARELKSHGVKLVEARGALSDVARHLQVELLELAIEAKKKEG